MLLTYLLMRSCQNQAPELHSDIQATSQDSSVHTDLNWCQQRLCILGLYRRYRNAVLLLLLLLQFRKYYKTEFVNEIIIIHNESINNMVIYLTNFKTFTSKSGDDL